MPDTTADVTLLDVERAVRKLREASAEVLAEVNDWLTEALHDPGLDDERVTSLQRQRGLVRAEIMRRIRGAR